MARPKTNDLSLEARIEAQALKWIKIADKAAAIADLQMDHLLAQVRDGAISAAGHVEVADVLKSTIANATATITVGLKTLAARRDDGGSASATPSEAELTEELLGKAG